MGKSSVLSIPKKHFQTLKDERTGKMRPADFAVQVGIPVLAGAICFESGWNLASASNAIVGISIVAALMCAMAVLVFQIRLDLRTRRDCPSRDLKLVDEVFANTMWAILVGLLLALYLIVWDACVPGLQGFASRLLSAIAVAICLHFVFVIGMCLKRLQSAYQRLAAK